MRRLAGPLLLLSASLLVCLGIAEGVARVLVPMPWGKHIDELAEHVPMAWSHGAFVADAALGYRPAPDFEGRVVRRGEYAIRFETNAHGLRDRAYREKPAGVRRVLVVGDSFVWGTGVEQDETFVEQLERRLEGQEPGRWEVWNAGVGGYGADQYALWLERLLPLYRPDLVLVGLFLGNDLHRYVPPEAQPAPRSIVARDGHRVRYRSALEYTLRRNSALAFFVLQRLDSREPAFEFGSAEEILRSLMLQVDAMREASAEQGAGFGVVLIPDRRQFRIVRHGPAFDYGREERIREFLNVCRAWLVQRFRRDGIPHLDLTPPIGRWPVGEVYFDVDGHFAPAGHARVAGPLARFVRELEASRSPGGAPRVRRGATFGPSAQGPTRPAPAPSRVGR